MFWSGRWIPCARSTAVARGLRRGRALREHTALREQTDRQAQEFNALYTVGQKVAALFNIEEILKFVVTAAVNLTGAQEGALMLLDANSGELYLRASCSSDEDDVRNLRVKVTDSLMGRVLQSGRPMLLDRGAFLKIRTSLLVTAMVSVPLIVGGHAIGVLSVYSRQAGRQFREHDVHLLSTLADFAAIAIRNADSITMCAARLIGLRCSPRSIGTFQSRLIGARCWNALSRMPAICCRPTTAKSTFSIARLSR